MRLIEVVYLILEAEDDDGYTLVSSRIDSTFRYTIGYCHWLKDICGY